MATDMQKAIEEKEKGNAAYAKRDFETALKHYDEAIKLDPSNITLLTNKAAVYFEQAEWGKCVELCEQAVEKGREQRVDYKIIAKALARVGNAYMKQLDYENAVKYFNKSLTEHRNPEVVARKNEAEKLLKEKQRLEYIDPQKSLEEKEKGNEYFKNGDFPGAIKHYSEAIKRNPDDAKLYSNRAACYTKLLEFQLALKDCEECIRLDPNFIKGHIRKGHALMALKDSAKAESSFRKALELDPQNQEAKDGLLKCLKGSDPEARRKRALQDPEIQQILSDPAMQMILQQMQSNPEALREHLQNPDIAGKIQKLLESEIIGIR
ncbi:hypothetical protein EMCRGX_G032297 [Ephydatia muelleri]